MHQSTVHNGIGPLFHSSARSPDELKNKNRHSPINLRWMKGMRLDIVRLSSHQSNNKKAGTQVIRGLFLVRKAEASFWSTSWEAWLMKVPWPFRSVQILKRAIQGPQRSNSTGKHKRENERGSLCMVLRNVTDST